MMMRALLVILTVSVACACSWMYPIWIPRSSNADPLYQFVKGGKAGYIDQTGRVIIPPTFQAFFGNSGGEFHDGLLSVPSSDGRYIDKSGKVVIKGRAAGGWDFSEGLAAAMSPSEKVWGYIDISGKFAITPRFASSNEDYVWSFQNGLAKVEVKGKFGYIDHAGNFVIPPRFLDASDFHEDMAWVVTDGPCVYLTDGPCKSPVVVGKKQTSAPSCRFGFIDKSGQVVSEARFDQVREFSEGLAPVRLGKVWGFADKTGAIAIAARFEDAAPFSSGFARIREKGRYGYIDKSGKLQLAAQYQNAESFSEGFAVVGDGPFWYIDRTGRKQFNDTFAAASPFFKGLAHVRFRGTMKFAYIDVHGKPVFSY
jgi:WG containing repeat